jgi:hypothetical protein
MDRWSWIVLGIMTLCAVWIRLSVLIERDQRKQEALERDDDLDPRDAEPMGVTPAFPRATAVPTDRAQRRADLAVRTHRAQSRVHAVRLDESRVGDREVT